MQLACDSPYSGFDRGKTDNKENSIIKQMQAEPSIAPKMKAVALEFDFGDGGDGDGSAKGPVNLQVRVPSRIWKFVNTLPRRPASKTFARKDGSQRSAKCSVRPQSTHGALTKTR